jgi:hypothetical protein
VAAVRRPSKSGFQPSPVQAPARSREALDLCDPVQRRSCALSYPAGREAQYSFMTFTAAQLSKDPNGNRDESSSQSLRHLSVADASARGRRASVDDGVTVAVVCPGQFVRPGEDRIGPCQSGRRDCGRVDRLLPFQRNRARRRSGAANNHVRIPKPAAGHLSSEGDVARRRQRDTSVGAVTSHCSWQRETVTRPSKPDAGIQQRLTARHRPRPVVQRA